MTPAKPMPDGVLLCTSCGLCCTGALHDTAALDEDEEASAAALGLPLVERGFALPCPHLKARRCDIYPDRPRVCGRYKCRLLQDVEADRLPLEQAIARVTTATALLSTALSHLSSDLTLADARRELLPGAQGRTGHAEARLHLIALTAYLDRHFRHATEGQLLRSQAVTTTGDHT